MPTLSLGLSVRVSVLADVAPPRDGGGSGHVVLTVVGVLLAVAVLVLIFAAVSRRR